ncbi:sulfurtransferase complex subunit TusC [Pasteurella sp. PK-2025]|uniref:sulfurtransferase complex subunit TusC n=1 Tax=unclassified Pasteurella TaxID=2621516 RepID=UPI003C760172
MMKLAFVFRSTPFGTATTREGLDALLAASAFCYEEDIGVFFLDDGVFNLLTQQQSEKILQKDVTSVLKLLDLYEIERRYVCQESLEMAKIDIANCVIDCVIKDRATILTLLSQAEKILTF